MSSQKTQKCEIYYVKKLLSSLSEKMVAYKINLKSNYQ